MFKVLQYSLGYTFRKTSTIVLLSLLFILSFAFPLVLYMGGIADSAGYEYVKTEAFFNGIWTIILIPIFLMLVSYLAVVTGQVFKRGEEDGTTLMLVSSRYTRTQVIIGRFGAMLIHILLVAFIFAFGMSLASGFYHPSQASYEVISFISLLFGTFFVGLFFTSLALIFSILMGRIGAIVTSVFLFVFMAIISPILVAATGNSADLGGLSHFDKYGKQDKEVFLYKDSNKKVKTQDVLKQQIPSQGDSTHLERLTSSKYNTFAWLDPWTQISQMQLAFNKESDNLSVLDKIEAVSLKDTDFFKSMKNIEDAVPPTATIKNPKAKLTFGLGQVFYDIVRNNEDISAHGFNHDQLIRIEDNFNAVVSKIESPEFEAMLTKYESIASKIKGYNVDDQTSGYLSYSLPISALAGLVNTIDEEHLNISSSTSLAFAKNVSNAKEGQIFSFAIEGVPNDNIKSYANSGTDELLGTDINKIVKRMAIYYAIFSANKAYATDQIINRTSASAKQMPIEEAIFSEFKGLFSWLGQSSMTAEGLETRVGYTFNASPIVPPAFIYIFWPAVSMGMFGLAYFLHRKADFK